MSNKINQPQIEDAVRSILEALGDDVNREGLKDTPKRVAKMFAEVFEGMLYTNKDIATKFDKCFEDEDIKTDGKDLVVIKDINIFSYCEHHLALMYNMKVHVAYIPNGKVIGLSKILRIADMVSRRLQLQERIGSDIAECLELVVGTSNIAVIIEGQHACMTARGIKKPGSITQTATLRGDFLAKSELRQELYSLIK